MQKRVFCDNISSRYWKTKSITLNTWTKCSISCEEQKHSCIKNFVDRLWQVTNRLKQKFETLRSIVLDRLEHHQFFMVDTEARGSGFESRVNLGCFSCCIHEVHLEICQLARLPLKKRSTSIHFNILQEFVAPSMRVIAYKQDDIRMRYSFNAFFDN
jgi:hypothetical protein